MGLFNKKYCAVCGEKIGLLGNRKLEDGNLCKNCAKELSPWFNERRHSTVDEIKAQLNYREENKRRVESFNVSRVLGEHRHILLDELGKCFTVTYAKKASVDENPDIVDFSAIISCRLNVDEDRDEVLREKSDGKRESYNPPRYEYSYDFDVIISVNSPYFDEMKVRLNSRSVEFKPEPAMQISILGRTITSDNDNPESCPEYRKYRDMGEDICRELDTLRGMSRAGTGAAAAGSQSSAYAVPSAAADDKWVCAACGASNTAKFCESCGSPRAAAHTGCSACGWKAPDGASVPKFCPECGNRLV